ncbi:MAG: 1,4-alpha-glucan branching enzyme [Rhodothermales bacterium]|jgi:1,4-alpha-glucan branching enzyme
MITKKISPKGTSVRLTFTLPADVASADAAVVGQFNDWDATKGAMKLDAKQGVWKGGISVKPGTRHEFRYVVDGGTWVNDEQADSYVANEHLGDNCVVEA